MVITLGIGLAAGASDTPTGALANRVATKRFFKPRSATRPGFLFFWPENLHHEEYNMTTYYRTDRYYRYDWRFSRFTAAPTPPERTHD